ncbi:sigma-54-dependent Fis family transcriptional regulator [candidate division TA06 bacterium]|uniref:Sigma-54-dependent Fis family transcriptional regulator n=1 Tax=candidate division TA06 bacterium TaxID=2250710 RepID=A0A523UWH2_UNCT6|nr:MAG: sigma-54-dependent Fis family transcriptional regulator [candidate division TA06 bacterium]
MEGAAHPFEFSGLISKDGKMRAVFNLIEKVASTNSPVLVLGETGSGKELVARAIHERSLRAVAPFIAINCAVLSETLLESELFGHERGAYTGAVSRKHGLFEVADKGTIFLDEIGDMPQKVQAKLLRALESKSFRRVGGTRDVKVDVRLLSASAMDLAVAIDNRVFRKDLYYRLSTVVIEIPPLRDRRDDIPVLVEFFLKRLERAAGGRRVRITGAAVDACCTFHWPGNVRELEHVIERSYVLSEGDVIDILDLPERLREISKAPSADALVPLEEIERRYIARVLKETGGNRTRAARILGIDRKTLYRKVRMGQINPTGSPQGQKTT